MRAMRMLTAAAATLGLLATGGPAAAKIMQLTLLSDGQKNQFDDVFNTIGSCKNRGRTDCGSIGKVDEFVFTYDTDRLTQGDTGQPTPTLLSATLNIYRHSSTGLINTTGAFLGSFNLLFGPDPTENAEFQSYYSFIEDDEGFYHIDIEDSAISPTVFVDDEQQHEYATYFRSNTLRIQFPLSGVGSLDQNASAYIDPKDPNNILAMYFIYQIIPDDPVFTNEYFNDHTIYKLYTSPDANFDEPGGFDNFEFKDITPPSVPEPAAWTLMLLGFGGLGAALRRDRRATAA